MMIHSFTVKKVQPLSTSILRYSGIQSLAPLLLGQTGNRRKLALRINERLAPGHDEVVFESATVAEIRSLVAELVEQEPCLNRFHLNRFVRRFQNV